MTNGRFRGDQWFDKKVHARTTAALQAQNAQFLLEHDRDNKEELLNYVRLCAVELGHTPNKDEIIGGKYVASRLGGWENVLTRLGLPQPPSLPEPTKREIYKQEFKRQAKLFQGERREAKKLRRQPEEQPLLPESRMK